MSKRNNTENNQNDVNIIEPMIKPKNMTQHNALEKLNDDSYKYHFLTGSAGTGKAQPYDRMVKTPYGWKPIGELNVGDEITAPDGSITFVEGIYPQGTKPIYEVSFEDGRSTECCDEHLWKVQHERWKGEFKIIETKEIKEKIDKSKNKAWYRKFRIPLIEHEKENKLKKDLLLDPYFLGIYLGDGSSTNGNITISSSDNEVFENLNEILLEDYTLKSCSKSITKRIARTYPDRKNNFNYYTDSLRNYNILKLKSYEKFIPVDYIDGSNFNEKIELIQGLLDSDGEVDSNGSIYFHTTSSKLKDGFIELIRSIGGIAYTKERFTKYNYNDEEKVGITSYRIRVRYRNPRDLFKLKRKKYKIKENNQYKDCNLGIENIEYVGDKKCLCISVTHKDHLYITDDYIVTHNTLLAVLYAIKKFVNKDYKKIVITRPAVNVDEEHGFLPGPQPLWSKILTTEGWVKMGDITTSHQVITPDGHSANIKDIFPQGMKDVYKVNTNTGKTTYACGEHIWEIWLYGEDGLKLKTTNQIQEMIEHQNVYLPHINYEKINENFGFCSDNIPKGNDCIQSIEYVGEEAVQCISIDDVRNLYITDDYIATHNTIEEKMHPWMLPIFDIFTEFFDSQTLKSYIENNIIEIAPLAYMRGRNLGPIIMDDEQADQRGFIIIADEMQNSTEEQMKMLLTRIGENSKMIITGDPSQHDRGMEKNGLIDVVKRIENVGIDCATIHKFKDSEVQRSKAVSDILTLYSND